MKITLVVLFLAGLTIYCKCAAVLSLPPSLIAHAASLDESLRTQKAFIAKDNEVQQQLLLQEEANAPTLAADSYRNFKNLWHNDLSLNLQKREDPYTFDGDIDDVAAMQQTMATINKSNPNPNTLQAHDNVGHINKNHNNDMENENILKFSTSSYLPLSQSSAVTKSELNIKPQLQFPLPKSADIFDDTIIQLPSSTEMIDDIFVSPPRQIQEEPLHLKRRELENVPLAAAASDTENAPFSKRFLQSTKYWSKPCSLENENNCLQEYYGALIANSNNALVNQLQHRQNYPLATAEKSVSRSNNNDINDEDIVLILTAEQNLMNFLSWALSELYPHGKLSNGGANETEYDYPGMYTWKNLNLSGRLEPPLLVQEPNYLIVRREYDRSDYDNEYKRGLNYGKDPFIPPRGRKHNLPDLDSLLQRYETFVPNRGRRDKIKDIFKYDDLFYPNRGKRQMTTAANDNGDTDERSDNTDIEDIKEIQHLYNKEENAERHEMQHPLLSNELMEYTENLMTKMKRKLHQQPKQQQDEKLANTFDEMSNRNEPTRGMSSTFQQAPPSASPSLLKKRLKSMINILYNRKKPQKQHLPNHFNERHQWWKRYTAAKTSSTKPANSNETSMPAMQSPTLVTNRLQTSLRSMSPLQQLTQLYQQQQQQQWHTDFSPPHFRPYNNKFMWLQLPKSMKSLAPHFDPLSWHKLQLSLQQQKTHQRSHQPLLTMRHPRLTALQHLPAWQQQNQQQQLQMATPQETQLTYSFDHLANRITNDLDNLYNKDLD